MEQRAAHRSGPVRHRRRLLSRVFHAERAEELGADEQVGRVKVFEIRNLDVLSKYREYLRISESS